MKQSLSITLSTSQDVMSVIDPLFLILLIQEDGTSIVMQEDSTKILLKLSTD
jgi:hypothetical protein